MWIKVTAYNDFDKKKLKKLYNYLSKTGYSEKIRDESVELWYGNIPENAKVTQFWQEKLIERLNKVQRGRKPTRYAYQVVLNAGVAKTYEEDFKQFLRELLDKYFADKYYYAFIHKDKNCIHAHLLIHTVSVNGDILRITRGEIADLQNRVKELEDKYGLRNKLFKTKNKPQRKNTKKINYEVIVNEHWGIRNIITNNRISRGNKAVITKK